MQHLKVDSGKDKGWFVGPWNSEVPVPIGYANTGVSLAHYHIEMYEIYLVARGQTEAVVDGETVVLVAGQLLMVEPGEVHTFRNSSEDYLHFVIQAPFVPGDKHIVAE